MSKILQLKRNEGVLPNKEAALDALREALKNGKAGEPMVVIFNGDVGVKTLLGIATESETPSIYDPDTITVDVPKLLYKEGVSDNDAYIDVDELTLPEAPDGWENILISVMYYDESIGGWSHCVSYKAVGNSLHLITGGPSYGVSVVVGGVDCYRCSNATWRAYYIQQKI